LGLVDLTRIVVVVAMVATMVLYFTHRVHIAVFSSTVILGTLLTYAVSFLVRRHSQRKVPENDPDETS
jgi:hypothetical protein